MRETIYLICDDTSVREMKKRPPKSIARDEVLVKLTVVIPCNAFNPSTLTAQVDVVVPPSKEDEKARSEFYADAVTEDGVAIV